MADTSGPWQQYQGSSGAAAPGPWSTYQATPDSGSPKDQIEKKLSGVDTGSFLGSVVHGGTFGLSDEIGAGVGGALQYGVGKLTGKAPKGATLGDFYDANLENTRRGQENYAQQHPALNTAGELLGGVMDFKPEAVTTALAKGFWPTVGQGAATGGAIGAAQGFGDAEGGVENRLEGAAIGGGLGAATGAAAPVAVPWVIGGVRSAGNMIQRAVAPWTKGLDSFIDETAGNVLNKVVGPDGATFQEPPLPGMKPTSGQSSDNPGMKWVERSVEQSSPEAAAASAEARTANNQAIHNAIGELGDVTAPAAENMSGAIDKASAASKASTRAAWKSAGVDETTGISAPQLQDHITDYVGSLSVANRKQIPGDVVDTIGELAQQGTTNLGEIQDLRSSVLGQIRMASRAGDDNKARVLGGLADTISDFIDNIPRPQEAADAYETARAATKQMKQDFSQPKAVRSVLGVDRFGDDKTPLSAVADTFIRSGKGAPEAFQSYLDAVNSQVKNAARPGQSAADQAAAMNDARANVAEGYQAARDAFAQRFLDKVTTADRDLAGAPIISAARVSNFLDDHAHVVNSEIFNDDQRDLISRISSAADMSQRTARAGAKGGSDTYGKLAGGKFLDVLIGPSASKLVPGIAAAVGAHVGGVPGAAAAYTAATFGENKIENLMFGATRDKVLSLVHEAIMNPALAKTLMQKASAKAALQIPVPQRRMIYSILGAQAGSRVGGALSGTQGQSALTP